MRVKVLNAEVAPAILCINPWPAHQKLFFVHGLLHVRSKLFKEVHKTACNRRVLAGFRDLFCLNHLFEKSVKHVLPIHFFERGREEIKALKTRFLERSLIE